MSVGRTATPSSTSVEPGDSLDLLESIDTLMRDLARVPPLEAGQGFSDAVSRPTVQVGSILGQRYQLRQLLGRGGMGAVYAACNLPTRREVAIKVLEDRATGLRQREVVIRFLREARAAARIHHPNVVDLYDVDCDQGVFYIVMERLHGESLRARLARGPLEPRNAVRIMRDAMRGVAEAHRRGVIHRDIKPDNVYLVSVPDAALPDPDARVKVLDFGVSRIVESPEQDLHSRPLTGIGQLLGTPLYMPPEQLRGDPMLDVRADVFALGVTLYELLSGVRPYDSANDLALLMDQIEQPFPSVLERVEGLDPALNALVMCALHPKAAARYPSVESFAIALTAWLEAEASRVPREPLTSRTGASGRQPRLSLWLGLLVLCAFAMAAALGLSSAQRPPSSAVTPENKHSPPDTPPAVEQRRQLVTSSASAPTGASAAPPSAAPAQASEQQSRPRGAHRTQPLPAPSSAAEKARKRETLLLPDDF